MTRAVHAWVVAVDTYDRTLRSNEPKREALAKAENDYQDGLEGLGKKKQVLNVNSSEE